MKKSAENVVARDVDEYLTGLSEKEKTALEKLRKAIKASAPLAEEVISYQIPTYKYFGPLVHFAAFKNHCSLFAVSKEILKTYEQELLPFKTSVTTIKFSADRMPPFSLIKKIVRDRVKENMALHEWKKNNVAQNKKQGLS